MLRFVTFGLGCLLAAGALAQNIIEMDYNYQSDGPLADAGALLVAGPGPYTYSLGGMGCGILLTGNQNYLYGKAITRATADWTGYFPFHTMGTLEPRSQERLTVGTLSGGPVEVMTLFDFTLTVNTAGRGDFVNWDMPGGNKWGATFRYFAQDLLAGTLVANWEGKQGPIGEFVATPGFSVRDLSPTAKQLVFKRTFATPRNVQTFRSVLNQVQAGNPSGLNFVELVSDTKVRYRATQPDGYIVGETDHTSSLLDRIVAPALILSGTKRNATVYLSTRSGVDRKIFLKADPVQPTTDVRVPAYVIIPAGQTSKLFGIDVRSATTAGNVKIMAVHDSKLVTANVVASPFPIAAFTVNPLIIHGGQTAEGTVTLAPGVTGPVSIVDDSDFVTLSVSSLPLMFGGTDTFGIQTSLVTANKLATITASRDIYNVTRTVTIVPASRLLSITATPTVVVGGNPSTAKVSIFGPAPLGGASVRVTSSSPFAIVPSTVIIAQGATFQTATVSTLPTSVGRTVVLIADLNGVSKTAVFTISP